MRTPPGFGRRMAIMPDAECNLIVISKSFGPRNFFGDQASLNDKRQAQAVAMDSDREWELIPAVSTESPVFKTVSAQQQTEYHAKGDMRVYDPVGLWLSRNITQMKFKDQLPGCPPGQVCITQSWIPDCDGSTFDVLDCHIGLIEPVGWEIYYESTGEFQCTSSSNPFCRTIPGGEYIPWNHNLNIILRARTGGDVQCFFVSSGAVPGVIIPTCYCDES